MTRVAKIYRPARNAMQSGKAKTKQWLLEFEPTSARSNYEVTGWVSSSDMDQEIQIAFETSEDAVRYAKSNNIEYTLLQPKEPKKAKRSYASNFS
jgi:ETC complex I subunit conserved region